MFLYETDSAHMQIVLTLLVLALCDIEPQNPPMLLLAERPERLQHADTDVQTETRTIVKEVVVEVDGAGDVEPAASYHPPPGDSARCYVLAANSPDADISAAASLVEKSGAVVRRRYSRTVQGLSFCTDSRDVLRRIDGSGLRIESDGVFRTASLQNNIPNHMYLMKHYEALVLNNHVYDSWVFRLLQIKRLLRSFFGSYEYHYTGRGVDIFLLDTAVTASGNMQNLSGATQACNKHGNIMAGLLAGPRHGFAKDSRLSVLDVVGCSGTASLSEILHALDSLESSAFPRVLVFGVSGPRSEILNAAVDVLARDTVVVAPAGNMHDQACSYSPGSARSAITVGSVNKHAGLSRFSNHGDCVRMFALGEDVLDDSSVSGTSFSAAIVGSAAAVFLEKLPKSTFADVWRFLDQNSFWNAWGSYSTLQIPHLGPQGLDDEHTALSELQERVVVYVVVLSVLLGAVYLLYLLARRLRRRDVLFDAPVNRF